ncbi:putative PPPDE peptidase domain-containing protein [Helianthus anomalus]
MIEVILHVYDVTNSGSGNTNNAILQINRIFKDGIGVGGIFHSAVQGLNSNGGCTSVGIWR